jgi:hypothetical protein
VVIIIVVLLGIWLYLATIGVLRSSSRMQSQSGARAPRANP